VRIAVFSPYPTTPVVHGARVRSAGLACGLAAAGADVTLISPWHPRSESIPGIRSVHHRLAASLLPWALPTDFAPAQALLSLQPTGFGPRRLFARLGRFDVYQFELCAQAAWMKLVPPGAAAVYSSHNVEQDFLRSEAHHFRVPANGRVARLERSAVRRADLVLSCSDADTRRMRELYGDHAGLVIPNGPHPELNGAPPPELRTAVRERLGLAPDEVAVLFVGGRAAHNREAVRFLVREVLPDLPERFRLILAGRSGEGAGANGRVIELGEVPDLEAVLAAADLGVNPGGPPTGTSVKVADYLAAGLPVLATGDGARAREGDGLLNVVDRPALADAIARAEPRGQGWGPGSAGHWRRQGERLLAEYRTLLPLG
jgi:glycosyltransferase involved in cell wall biosynthesis